MFKRQLDNLVSSRSSASLSNSSSLSGSVDLWCLLTEPTEFGREGGGCAWTQGCHPTSGSSSFTPGLRSCLDCRPGEEAAGRRGLSGGQDSARPWCSRDWGVQRVTKGRSRAKSLGVRGGTAGWPDHQGSSKGGTWMGSKGQNKSTSPQSWGEDTDRVTGTCHLTSAKPEVKPWSYHSPAKRFGQAV